MARANNGGWDFVKVGGVYQYKEDDFIAMVEVVKDNSTKENYSFDLRVLKSSYEPPQDGEFGIFHAKDPGGYWSGMLQIYEREEYMCSYTWERENSIQ